MKSPAKLIVFALAIFFVEQAKADTYILDVPFVSQVLPGDWNHTRNCGPTSALMLAGYYLSFVPVADDIKAIDDWLYDQQIIYPQSGVDQYNGNYTNLDDLKYLISDYFNLGHSEKVYPSDSKEEYVKEQIRRGNPVIVAVRLNMQAGGAGHFMVVIGYDDEGVVVHDPGHSAANGGLANHYPYDQFIASWASWDYASLHVKQFVSWHPNGTLVKDHFNPDVYVLLDNAKHAILNWEVFLAHQFDADKIIEVSQQELDCYADSWMVDWKPYRETFGTSDGYYLLEKLNENDNGCAIYDFASDFSAESWGNYVPDIPILPEQEAYEIIGNCNYGKTLYIRDGSLIKPEPALIELGFGQGAVFVMHDDGIASAFENYEVFEQMNYDPNQIVEIDRDEFLLGIKGFGELITLENLTQCSVNGLGSSSECLEGDILESYSGLMSTHNIGICQPEQKICFAGYWYKVQEQILPQEEIEDGQDNDCDGQVDEDFTEEIEVEPDPEPEPEPECQDGEWMSIYSGPFGTYDVGTCQVEIKACQNSEWVIEQEEVVPQEEIEDGLDNDCDGMIDEGFEPESEPDPEPEPVIENPVTPSGNLWAAKDCGQYCIAFCSQYLAGQPDFAVMVGDFPGIDWNYQNGIIMQIQSDGYYYLYMFNTQPGIYRVSYTNVYGLWAQYGDTTHDDVGPFRWCGFDGFEHTCSIKFEITDDGEVLPVISNE